MKKNKALSILLSGILSVSLLSSISAVAEEEKIYTYAELAEMSNDEFFSLEKTFEYYKLIKDDAEYYENFFGFDYYSGLSGILYKFVTEEDGYIANETEMMIERLLGNKINYEICSPISIKSDHFYYENKLAIYFPDLVFYAEYQEIPDEAIVDMTKCWYCVNQIFEISYQGMDELFSSSGDKQVLKGDVNFDRAVNMSDAVHMSKLNMNYYKSLDAQNVIGDLNNDSNMDTLDLYLLCEYLLGNYELV